MELLLVLGQIMDFAVQAQPVAYLTLFFYIVQLSQLEKNSTPELGLCAYPHPKINSAYHECLRMSKSEEKSFVSL